MNTLPPAPNWREYSIDAKRLEKVEEEIKSQGGDVLSVAGDVGADDFPKTIVDATIQCVLARNSIFVIRL